MISGLGDDLDRAGGGAYVFTLIERGAPPSTLGHHIETIKNESLKYKLRGIGERIKQLPDQLEASQALAESQKLVDSLLETDETEVKSVGELIGDVAEHIVDVQEGKIPQGLMTGFYDLDEKIGGLKPGQLVIVAARPGVGKTTLAVDIMRHVSVHEGIPTGIFSMEMTARELVTRMISAEGKILSNRINKQDGMQPDDWQRFNEALEVINKAPIYIDGEKNLTAVSILAKGKMWVKRFGVKLIVVDYVQLAKSGLKTESKQQDVAEISRQLKLLAMECNIPVIGVAQLNRGAGKEGAKPRPSDLKDSGALEQDADVVLLLDRPSARDEFDESGEVEVIVGKNRAGEIGSVSLADTLYYSKFSNLKRDL